MKKVQDEKDYLIQLGFVPEKTNRILSKNKMRAKKSDEEKDFLKAWEEPKKDEHGNNKTYMSGFYI